MFEELILLDMRVSTSKGPGTLEASETLEDTQTLEWNRASGGVVPVSLGWRATGSRAAYTLCSSPTLT